MSSDRTPSARARASRINGAKSRGPRTAAGKARSSRNALKHGLCAQKILVLPDEDAAAFKALEAALQAELAPPARSRACSRSGSCPPPGASRADRMEAEVLDFRRGRDGDLGLAFIRDANTQRAFPILLRYRHTALAELLRAHQSLRALRAAPPDAAAPAPARPTARLRPAPPNECIVRPRSARMRLVGRSPSARMYPACG
jgi:hypothetical protein